MGFYLEFACGCKRKHAARPDMKYAVAHTGLPGNYALGGKRVRDPVIVLFFLTIYLGALVISQEFFTVTAVVGRPPSLLKCQVTVTTKPRTA